MTKPSVRNTRSSAAMAIRIAAVESEGRAPNRRKNCARTPASILASLPAIHQTKELSQRSHSSSKAMLQTRSEVALRQRIGQNPASASDSQRCHSTSCTQRKPKRNCRVHSLERFRFWYSLCRSNQRPIPGDALVCAGVSGMKGDTPDCVLT